MGDLDALLRPRSIAVIGASRRRDSIGGAILRNLIDQGFQGPVYPINPNAPFVQSIPAYPSVASVPGEVELAIIVIPADQVMEAARSCGEKGVRALIVISAGFKETGEEGQKREHALVERTVLLVAGCKRREGQRTRDRRLELRLRDALGE